MSRDLQVYGDWHSLGRAKRIGILSIDAIRGKETTSFAYDPHWLNSSNAMNLDPELHLYEGFQYPHPNRKGSFGIFLDSAPDRWGRMLMQRRESLLAKSRSKKPKPLTDTDYLLGVHDEQRQGALRFRESDEGPFLSDDSETAAPPWTALRDLEQAAWCVQSDGSEAKMNESLRLLMAPGSSIGGARPKAGVVDEINQLWIAKFPGRNDARDVAAWEMVAHRIAKNAGVTVADAKIEAFGRKHRTFLSKRFDRVNRDGTRYRVHFASALTMLGHSDGTDHSTGASYLELVEWIMQNQSIVDEDLEELWRRIVLSIMIHNTDDHLRNHGFLLTEDGWRLSPAFDLNQNRKGWG